ncbi:YeeE/YedE family protein [Massilia endophytica]|uniref:YeeE/YedE family protein n=1 Tax=Massilia endophytica TaxID=2899220 RepID=UPI001E3B09DF|nr:YeeE/YedE family protein [Massilia endophytica]UGQ48774.1 YeeE/YedE family protein [Massilia endophytica]
MQILMALLSGLLFGVGLIVSGMTDPAKVIGFLDIGGRWDPSLAFVMLGAIAAGFIGFRLARQREQSLLGEEMHLPTARRIDRRLILGAIVFGAGWGLAGFCPGPALASLLSAGIKPAIFTAAMLGGMAVFELIERLPQARR